VRVIGGLAVLAALVLIAGCGPHGLSTAPPPPRACVDAWISSFRGEPDGAFGEPPLRSCGSLAEYYWGERAAYELEGMNTDRIAEGLCTTGRFADTPVCRELRAKPPKELPSPTAP
jgi:hypothetical protein